MVRKIVMPSQGIQPRKILLLVDDQSEISQLQSAIRSLGLKSQVNLNPDKALEKFDIQENACVIIHYRNHPQRGLDICSLIKAKWQIPVLMITARNEVVNESMAISAGADDYIVKPIERRILISRLLQQIELAAPINRREPSLLGDQQFQLDLNAHSLSIKDHQILLTKIEFLLLKALLERPNTVLSKG